MVSLDIKPRGRTLLNYDSINDHDLGGIIANKLAATIYSASELVRRNCVYKKEVRLCRKKLIECMATGDNSEAFAYAKTILVHKRKMAWNIDLSRRVIDFTDYVKLRSDKVDRTLYNYLDSVSYLALNGFLSELEKYVTRAENYFGYLDYFGRKSSRVGAIKITRKSVRAFMDKVRNNPKVASMMTTTKSKSFMELRSRPSRTRSNFFKFK